MVLLSRAQVLHKTIQNLGINGFIFRIFYIFITIYTSRICLFFFFHRGTANCMQIKLKYEKSKLLVLNDGDFWR